MFASRSVNAVERVYCIPGESYLAALDGSCETPIAGLAVLNGGTVDFRGEILRPDGSEIIVDADSGAIEDGAEMGRAVAERMRAKAPQDFFSWLTA